MSRHHSPYMNQNGPPPGPYSGNRSRNGPPFGPPAVPIRADTMEMQPRVLDIYGGHRDITVCGHIDVIHLLPVHRRMHKQLLETFKRNPGNYEGKFENDDEAAKVLDYGNGYVAVRLYDDLTRPELGEFLLTKGWRLMGFSSTKDSGKTIMYEKWTNVHVRADAGP